MSLTSKIKTLFVQAVGSLFDLFMHRLHGEWGLNLVKEYHNVQVLMGYPKGYPYEEMVELERKYNPNLRMYRLKALYHFRKSQRYARRIDKRIRIIERAVA